MIPLVVGSGVFHLYVGARGVHFLYNGGKYTVNVKNCNRINRKTHSTIHRQASEDHRPPKIKEIDIIRVRLLKIRKEFFGG
jgi:hypothetical protein